MTDFGHPDPAEYSMIDLFRSEVEAHSAIMNSALLALENSPESVARTEELMRAAHSIKGGARIVELENAIRIAHTMEDCFVAARKTEKPFTSDQIDILLKGVDLLVQIAENASENIRPEMEDDSTSHLVEAVEAITRGDDLSEYLSPPSPVMSESQDPAPPKSETASETVSETGSEAAAVIEAEAEPKAPTHSEKPPESETQYGTETGPVKEAAPEAGAVQEMRTTRKAEPSAEEMPGRERMVRVTASKIERLMGLAGEVVVSARWLPPYTSSLLRLKRHHGELSAAVDELLKAVAVMENGDRALALCQQVREKAKDGGTLIAERLSEIDMFTNISATLSDRLYHEVIGVRMCPFSDGTRKFPRLIRDIARQLGKKVRLEIGGESTEVDRDILEKLDAPLTHLLCNAVAHGIESPEKRKEAGKEETGIIRLEAAHRAGMLMIIVSDDGQGIEPEDLRNEILEKKLARPDIAEHLSESELMDFLFLPGFSTTEDVTEISGRGVGLDVVHSTVHEVGGVIRVITDPGKGLSFHLELPLTLSVIRTFLVEIDGEPYAFPLARIDRCLRVEWEEIRTVEERQYFRFDEANISLVDIREILELEPETDLKREILNIVVISDRSHAYGLVVDRFLGECDLVVRPLDSRLGKIPDISAAAVMMDGSPVLIFDVEDIVHSITNLLSGRGRLGSLKSGGDSGDGPAPKRILVVEDSFIVREKERKLLENRGYAVEVAVDGQDGWNLLRTAEFDLVITDIDMPRMNGFELIRHIRRHGELQSVPVIIVSYKTSEDDRLKGMKVGANYYLTKTDFDDSSMIDAVIDLIGEP